MAMPTPSPRRLANICASRSGVSTSTLSVISRSRRRASNPVSTSASADSLTDIVEPDLCRRDVDRQLAVPVPRRDGLAGLGEHEGAQRYDQARFFGQRDEVGRRDLAELRAMPAHQRLDADQAPSARLICGWNTTVNSPRPIA